MIYEYGCRSGVSYSIHWHLGTNRYGLTCLFPTVVPLKFGNGKQILFHTLSVM